MTPTSKPASSAFEAFRKRPHPLALVSGVQHYDWGQRGDEAYIPRLLGQIPEKDKPYAELWIGDHPVLPSRAVFPEAVVPLPELIAFSAEAILGQASRRTFGDRLPFLMKVLAAGKALSIQAHPGKKQAEEGFAREEAAGVARSAPERIYKDDNHKPEILVALTSFHGLNRFRPLEEIARVFESEAPELKRLSADFKDRLSAAVSEEARKDLLKSLVERSLALPQREVNALLTPLVKRLEASSKAPFPVDSREHWVLRADRDYSRGTDKDRGLFSLYFLNLVSLSPGEAMYLDAGELHAYLEGVGVEVMANSDNVLRGGLTPKHIDIPELLRTLTFSAGPAEILHPGSDGLYAVPAPEFNVAVWRLAPGARQARAADRGVDVLLVTEGESVLASGGEAVPLRRGVPVLVPAALGAYAVSSEGGSVVYRASVPCR